MKHNLNRLVLTTVLTLCLSLSACKEDGESEASSNDASKVSHQKNYAIITQHPVSVGNAAQRIISSNKLTVDDLDKVDFTKPGDSAFGSNEDYAVFGSKGGAVPITEKTLSNYKDISNKPEYFFTISNRVAGLGTEKTELIAFLPDPYPEVCDAINSGSNNKATNQKSIIEIKEEINLSPVKPESDKSQIPTLDLLVPFGCVRTHNRLYYYQIIIER